MPEPGLEIAVECIECGQDVCIHQQTVIRRLEAEGARLREALRECRDYSRGTAFGGVIEIAERALDEPTPSWEALQAAAKGRPSENFVDRDALSPSPASPR